MTIDKRLKNYTCFCKAFMIFINEKEVKISNSEALQAFTSIASVKDFLDLGLPIKKYTIPDANGKIVESSDLTEIYKDKKN